MTTETLSPVPVQRFYDNGGNPLVGGKLFTYIAGTTTKQSTFTDSTGVTPNANPTILDYRGEARVWIPPNVAYKYVLAPSTDTDPPTSPIWTVDQLVNSQLITLYGGVDTGSANTYLLNFVANFTAYADGIIIYWIPANTNTGASTINVNGLGVVNIVNPDGSAVSPNQIVANQPAQILFKAGAFQLITPAASLIKSATIAWVGFVTPPSSTSITYRRTGNLAAITFLSQTGVSNATNFQLTGLPSLITSSVISQLVPCMGMMDNGAIVTGAGVAQVTAGGTISFFKDSSLGLWTAAGNKGFNSNTTIVYPL